MSHAEDAPARAAGPRVTVPTHGGAASTIPGVRWGAVTRHADERGSFREVWRDAWFPDLEAAAGPGARFRQANFSTSAAGVLRGLHFHRRQLDFWVVEEGVAWVALVDVRPLFDGSGDRPIVETRELAADGTVAIPAGDHATALLHHPEVELPAVEVEPPENARRGRGEVGLTDRAPAPARFQVGEPAVAQTSRKLPRSSA